MKPDADDTWLLALGAAVSDGKPVDWDAAARSAADPEQRRLVDDLRRVAALADVHRAQPTGHWRHLQLFERIGEGAYGTVFRGWDPKLEREVAVKLLGRAGGDLDSPIDEARHLARVRHANIVTVYGADRDGGQAGLWMEYLKGQTLADLVRSNGPMSEREATGVALDLSHALSALHGAGLLHRDIKASNVMREVGGRIVLMDFSGAHAAADRSDGGRFSGTPLFMAPELFDNGSATPASDVYSLGVLLFFVLTASVPVTGNGIADLKHAHSAGARRRLRDLRPDLSDGTVQVVERMTAADPAQRFQTAGELEAALLAASGLRSTPAAATPASRWWPAAVSAALLVAAAGLLLWTRAPAEPAPLVRFSIGPPFMSTGWPRLAPTGAVAFGTAVEGRNRFWVRPLDAPDGHVLQNTTAAETPFWSPDGRTLAFFADDKLKKITVVGGDVETVTDAPAPHGGDWSGNWMLFAGDAGIFRVAPDGTQRRQLTSLDASHGDRQHAWPEFLPDGNRFLYIIRSTDAARTGLYLSALDGSVNRRVTDVYSRTAYSAGHILFVRDGTLEAQPFDPVRGDVTGQPAVITSHIKYHPRSDAAFDATPSGVLAYAAESGLSMTRLVLYDRRGRELRVIAPPDATYRQPRFSPDGRRIVVEKGAASATSTNLLLFDLARGSESHLADAPPDEHFVNPAWSPDGRRIAFSKRVNGDFVIVSKLVDGTGPEERLAALDGDTMLEDWSRDGRYLSAAVRRDGLWIIPLDRQRKPWRLQADPRVDIWQSEFSPDGKWIAYMSEASGRPEVFVEPLPATGARFQMSPHGGGEPHWSADGRELFFLDAGAMLMSMDVTAGDWQHASPTPHFRLLVSEIGGKLDYSLSPDGQSIAVNVFVADPAVPPIEMVVNWTALLKR